MLSVSSDLSDLARDKPDLTDATAGATGVRLIRYVGGGNMASVFEGRCADRREPRIIDLDAPERIAIKILKPSFLRDLERTNQLEVALETANKEVRALEPIKCHKPPTEFVVSFYGHGSLEVAYHNRPYELPWLALEFVDGGTAGTTLGRRVEKARETDGVDPVRAEKLVRKMLEGLQIVHRSGVIHRDLKPENIFVTGPVDDETPKIGDFGIARIEGGNPSMSIAALTKGYGSSEQGLGVFRPGRRNPLVGSWTDVNALAAVIWFIVAGDDWYADERSWNRGERRSLREVGHIHPGFASEGRLIERIADVLTTGTSIRPPDMAWDQAGAQDYEQLARSVYGDAMFSGRERHATVDALADELLPLLTECSQRWRDAAARQNRSMTAFRPTQIAQIPNLALGTTAQVAEVDVPRFSWKPRGKLAPDCVVFQPDGKVLGRLGGDLVYVAGSVAHRVVVPQGFADAVRDARWVARGPEGGFAIIAPHDIILVRAGTFNRMALPTRARGEVGKIQAAIGDGRVFGVVTEETEESDGPELWTSLNGREWQTPSVLALAGDVHAVAYGPYGFIVVGSRKGKNARALALGLDGKFTPFREANEHPPLRIALSGTARESWAAGTGILLRFDRASCVPERAEIEDEPVAMGLDLVGSPWLVTRRAVMRRVEGAAGPLWKVLHRQPRGRPDLVGIGFTTEGGRVIDEQCGGVLIRPWDLSTWRVSTTDGSG